MRDKLAELIGNAPIWKSATIDDACMMIADYLIANGVTFATDKWISVNERLPKPFISVLVQMPLEEPCPTVREGFLTNNGTWYAGMYTREADEVTHWMPMPEPPEEEIIEDCEACKISWD